VLSPLYQQLFDLAFPSSPQRRPAKTHRQLHDEVESHRTELLVKRQQLHDAAFSDSITRLSEAALPRITVMGNPVSIPGTPAPVPHKTKTHKELHNEVFPYGYISTPSGVWGLAFAVSATTPPQRKPAPSIRTLLGSASRRSVAGAPVGLPPKPDHLRGTHIRSGSKPDVPEDLAPVVLRRSQSTAVPSSAPARSSIAGLPRVEERGSLGLRRSPSNATSNGSGTSSLERSASVPASKHRKRDSVVMQRVRAINGSKSLHWRYH
jgi:hypothetical protein